VASSSVRARLQHEPATCLLLLRAAPGSCLLYRLLQHSQPTMPRPSLPSTAACVPHTAHTTTTPAPRTRTAYAAASNRATTLAALAGLVSGLLHAHAPPHIREYSYSVRASLLPYITILFFACSVGSSVCCLFSSPSQTADAMPFPGTRGASSCHARLPGGGTANVQLSLCRPLFSSPASGG